jgi:cytochrome P450
VVADVIQRRTDFRRNMEQFAIVNVYGKNLSTTDDEEWQKHRKVTAVTFTEKNNELVWHQSLMQARGMQDYWLEHQPVKTIANDTKVFTLNVLAAAIFNKSYPYKGAAESDTKSTTQDESYQYRDSLGRIFGHIIPLFVFGAKGLQAWWTPRSWKAAGAAVSTYRSYVTKLINEERDSMAHGVQKNQNLLAALVRACESEHSGNDQTVPGMKSMSLTEEEIISNLFVFAFAGNDTSAIALTNVLVHMAASPETQEWIAEEIRHYLPGDDISQWSYKTFPKLKRCLAVVVGNLSAHNVALTDHIPDGVPSPYSSTKPTHKGDRKLPTATQGREPHPYNPARNCSTSQSCSNAHAPRLLGRRVDEVEP